MKRLGEYIFHENYTSYRVTLPPTSWAFLQHNQGATVTMVSDEITLNLQITQSYQSLIDEKSEYCVAYFTAVTVSQVSPMPCLFVEVAWRDYLANTVQEAPAETPALKLTPDARKELFALMASKI